MAKKPLKTVVFTLHDGSTVTAADTIENPAGSNALSMYDNKRQIVVQGENEVTKFDFAQVVKAVVTSEASDEYTRPDPYCPDEGESE